MKIFHKVWVIDNLRVKCLKVDNLTCKVQMILYSLWVKRVFYQKKKIVLHLFPMNKRKEKKEKETIYTNIVHGYSMGTYNQIRGSNLPRLNSLV